MKILFVHQNFPAQFARLANALADAGHEIVALTRVERTSHPKIRTITYRLLRERSAETHPLLQEEEGKLLNAEAVASACFALKNNGFVPNIMFAHPGWGEALFLKDAFPQSKLVIYCEYHYSLHGQDVGFDPIEPPPGFSAACRLRVRNLMNLSALDAADFAYAPTEWQRSTFPHHFHDKIKVIHEGVDAEQFRFRPGANLSLTRSDGSTLEIKAGSPVLTFIARGLEPIRGFHIFMRALPQIQQAVPDAQVVILGNDIPSYGSRSSDGRSWKERMLYELDGKLDLNRIHFLGTVGFQAYRALTSISKCHVYLTAPFVLSWSFVEIAAAGVPIIASDTPPVREFARELKIETVDFFDVSRISDEIAATLMRPFTRAQRSLPERLTAEYSLNQLMQFLK